MPYLKVEPDTYNLSYKQMFKFDTCQFCGCEDWNLRFYINASGKAENQRGNLAHTIARRSCAECSKTTALVKSNID
jgi:hypothetical protein